MVHIFKRVQQRMAILTTMDINIVQRQQIQWITQVLQPQEFALRPLHGILRLQEQTIRRLHL